MRIEFKDSTFVTLDDEFRIKYNVHLFENLCNLIETLAGEEVGGGDEGDRKVPMVEIKSLALFELICSRNFETVTDVDVMHDIFLGADFLMANNDFWTEFERAFWADPDRKLSISDCIDRLPMDDAVHMAHRWLKHATSMMRTCPSTCAAEWSFPFCRYIGEVVTGDIDREFAMQVHADMVSIRKFEEEKIRAAEVAAFIDVWNPYVDGLTENETLVELGPFGAVEIKVSSWIRPIARDTPPLVHWANARPARLDDDEKAAWSVYAFGNLGGAGDAVVGDNECERFARFLSTFKSAILSSKTTAGGGGRFERFTSSSNLRRVSSALSKSRQMVRKAKKHAATEISPDIFAVIEMAIKHACVPTKAAQLDLIQSIMVEISAADLKRGDGVERLIEAVSIENIDVLLDANIVSAHCAIERSIEAPTLGALLDRVGENMHRQPKRFAQEMDKVLFDKRRNFNAANVRRLFPMLVDKYVSSNMTETCAGLLEKMCRAESVAAFNDSASALHKAAERLKQHVSRALGPDEVKKIVFGNYYYAAMAEKKKRAREDYSANQESERKRKQRVMIDD